MWHLFVLIFVLTLPFFCKGDERVSSCIYVSSSIGNDANNGTSPDYPVKTIEEAYTRGNGKTILLKAGDVFSPERTVIIGRGLSRYGDGNNPILSGYKRIIEPNWEKVHSNIWRISLVQDNYWGVQIKGSSLSNNVGCIHEYDKDIIHGRKRINVNELERNWDFCQMEKKGSKDATCFDSLYLYSSVNPNKLKLEFSTGQIAITVRNGFINFINIEGYGFGVLAGSDVLIKGCHIDAIGGRSFYTESNYVCDGNGIGIWIYGDNDTENTTVEDCYITRVYDSGVCLSGDPGFSRTARNVTIKNNLIVNCCQGFEDFLLNDPPSVYRNCSFVNNVVVFSGSSGFGYPSSRFKFCHILSNNFKGDKKMIFEDNIFIGGNFQCNGGFEGLYTSNVMKSNICYITKENYLLGNYTGTKDVIRMGLSPRKAISSYRSLTEDNSTRFILRNNSSIKRIGKKAISKYLQNHSY